MWATFRDLYAEKREVEMLMAALGAKKDVHTLFVVPPKDHFGTLLAPISRLRPLSFDYKTLMIFHYSGTGGANKGEKHVIEKKARPNGSYPGRLILLGVWPTDSGGSGGGKRRGTRAPRKPSDSKQSREWRKGERRRGG